MISHNDSHADVFQATAPIEYGGSLTGQYVAASATLPPGCLLLIRVGDFYEAWGDQANILADALGITLTGRMAGVPYHSIERHLATLDEKGVSWALLDHITDPKLPSVRRAITRRSAAPAAPVDLTQQICEDVESPTLDHDLIGHFGGENPFLPPEYRAKLEAECGGPE